MVERVVDIDKAPSSILGARTAWKNEKRRNSVFHFSMRLGT